MAGGSAGATPSARGELGGSPSDQAFRCPLCDGTTADPVASLEMEEVWSEFRRQWGAVFSADVRGSYPDGSIQMLRCRVCSLEYFWPTFQGDTAFYSELMSQVPYEHERWEFGLVRRYVETGQAVVDLGCGPGDFLASVKEKASRVVGIDQSERAISSLIRQGIEARDEDFWSFSESEQGSFDIVAAFQVVEHFTSISDVIGPAIRCLRPDGRLFVSVPNRERVGKQPLEVLDVPPHHVTRWGHEQLSVLAKEFGLLLEGVHFSEPLGFEIVEGERQRAAANRGLAPSDWVRRVFTRALVSHWVYPHLAARQVWTRRGIFGHTMLAVYRIAPGRAS